MRIEKANAGHSMGTGHLPLMTTRCGVVFWCIIFCFWMLLHVNWGISYVYRVSCSQVSISHMVWWQRMLVTWLLTSLSQGGRWVDTCLEPCMLFVVCSLFVGWLFVVAYHLTLTLKGRGWNKSTYFVAIRASFWVVGSCDVMSVACSAYAALQAGRGDSSAPGAPLMHFDGFPRERWSAVLDVFSELCNLPDHCHKDPLVQQVAQPQKRQGLSGWRCIVSQQVGGPKCSTLCPMVLGKCTVRNHFLWYSPKNAGPCVWFWIPRVGKPGFADMAAQEMCCRNHYSSSFCWGDPASWRKYIKMTIQLK